MNPPIPTKACCVCGGETNETQSVYGIAHMHCYKNHTNKPLFSPSATARIAEGCAESWNSTGKKPTRVYIDMTLWLAICREQFVSVFGFSPTCRPSKDCRIGGMRVFLVDDPGHLAYAWCAEDEQSNEGQNT